jgi:hypothetical protein
VIALAKQIGLGHKAAAEQPKRKRAKAQAGNRVGTCFGIMRFRRTTS